MDGTPKLDVLPVAPARHFAMIDQPEQVNDAIRKFERCGAGRLEVRFDGHLHPVDNRINRPTEIVNVVATLPGHQAASKDRLYVVSGHYDSRVTDVMNYHFRRPGRQRRRLRHRGRDRDGLRDGAPQVRRHPGLHDGGGRRTGPVRRRPLREGSQGRTS
jgi:hypothetical protein